MDEEVVPTSICQLVNNFDHTIYLHLQNSTIRSLILNRTIDGGGVFLHKYLKLLRVLHVDLVEGHLLPLRKVGQLIHLKYLCLSKTSKATRLSQLIDGLVNLQTLDSGDNYIGLPHTIWKLKQMRHLICFRGQIISR